MKRDYVLLTGATGLLGQYLLRDLLKAGHRMAVIVRGNKSQTAAQRVERIMQFWEQELDQLLPRPMCLEGDITQPRLGLDSAATQWVRDHVDRMFHCAASLTFHEQNGEPWRTNVEGTRHVVEFCGTAKIEDIHYVSTAYVCGQRQDLVKENELDVGQDFRNDYEKSKYQAEQIVREYPAFRQRTIYRPVVITGDSETGYTSTYHGTYLYMKLAAILAQNVEPDEQGNRHIPIRWGATGEERRNITPVNWNSDVICRLFNNPDAHGQTFHLAPAEPLTMREVIEYAARYFHITGVEFHGYGDQPDFKLNELERWIWSNVKIYGSYDFMDANFDMTNLLKLVPDSPSPRIDDRIAQKLMNYAVEDRWGKRKPKKPDPAPIEIERVLTKMTEPIESATAHTSIVGLDVWGPGGGQFRLFLCEDRLVQFQPGLPATGESEANIQLSSHQFGQLCEQTDSAEGFVQQIFAVGSSN